MASMFNWIYGPNLVAKVDRLSTYAAALAYCVVLSMVPFLAVTFALGMQIADYLGLEQYAQNYKTVLSEIIPVENSHETDRIFDVVQKSYAAQGHFVIIGFLVATYTSFNLMEQIFRTILFIFDDPRRPMAWSWTMMVKTLALLGIWMLLLLLISISAVEASELQALTQQFVYPNVTGRLVRALQIMVVIGALFGTFYLTYHLVPVKKHPRHLVVEGSLLASCGWVASSLMFAYFIPKLLATNAAYIALGSIVAILLWAQACAWSVILGACWMVRFSPKPK